MLDCQLVGLSVGLLVGMFVAEGSEHATLGDWPFFFMISDAVERNSVPFKLSSSAGVGSGPKNCDSAFEICDAAYKAKEKPSSSIKEISSSRSNTCEGNSKVNLEPGWTDQQTHRQTE